MKSMKEIRQHLHTHWPSYRARLLGSGSRKGLLYYIAIYFLSITFAFVFIYPIFYMFMISMMSNRDLVDSTIMWIPSKIYWNNYLFSLRGLGMNRLFIFSVWQNVQEARIGDLEYSLWIEIRKFLIFFSMPFMVAGITWLYAGWGAKVRKAFLIGWAIFAVVMLLPRSYVDSVYVAGTTTLVTVISSAFIGYGLARFKFKGKGFIMAMMILIYILPKTLLFIPLSILYGSIGIKGTMFALWFPALLGQGVQATFFILIFFQFFRMIPAQIEESAYLDGASSFYIFVKLAIPMAVPAIVISMTYGFAVNWNELFLTNAFLEGNIKTIPMLLQGLQSVWGSVANYDVGGDYVDVDFTEAKSFAGTMLSIVPLVIMYGVVQRYFIESIDKSGIAGE